MLSGRAGKGLPNSSKNGTIPGDIVQHPPSHESILFAVWTFCIGNMIFLLLCYLVRRIYTSKFHKHKAGHLTPPSWKQSSRDMIGLVLWCFCFVPLCVLLSALMTAFLFDWFEPEMDRVTAFFFTASSLAGLVAPFTSQIPRTINGQILAIVANLWFTVLNSGIMGMTAAMRPLSELAENMPGSCVSFAILVLIYIPLCLFCYIAVSAELLKFAEGWTYGDAFLLVSSQVCGLANPLTSVSPQTVSGGLLFLIISVADLCLAGTIIGLIGSHAMTSRIVESIQGEGNEQYTGYQRLFRERAPALIELQDSKIDLFVEDPDIHNTARKPSRKHIGLMELLETLLVVHLPRLKEDGSMHDVVATQKGYCHHLTGPCESFCDSVRYCCPPHKDCCCGFLKRFSIDFVVQVIYFAGIYILSLSIGSTRLIPGYSNQFLLHMWVLCVGIIASIGLLIKNLLLVADIIRDCVLQLDEPVKDSINKLKGELEKSIETELGSKSGSAVLANAINSELKDVDKSININGLLPCYYHSRCTFVMLAGLPSFGIIVVVAALKQITYAKEVESLAMVESVFNSSDFNISAVSAYYGNVSSVSEVHATVQVRLFKTDMLLALMFFCLNFLWMLIGSWPATRAVANRIILVVEEEISTFLVNTVGVHTAWHTIEQELAGGSSTSFADKDSDEQTSVSCFG